MALKNNQNNGDVELTLSDCLLFYVGLLMA